MEKRKEKLGFCYDVCLYCDELCHVHVRDTL